jgi:L-histidine N-alpha-methyltransferase
MTPMSGALSAAVRSAFAEDVRLDLQRTPRQLQSKYLYDDLGSALFEAICALPWYGITEAERRLLARWAPEIVWRLGDRPLFIELGAGSGEKLASLARHANGGADVSAHLIDISPAALDLAGRTLASVPGVTLTTERATYEEGLTRLRRASWPESRGLLLFLGSNVGNFDPPVADRLLARMRAALDRDDRFLLGADLVKPERALLLAYDDPLGVTAAFNKNLLVRLNRELDADVDLGAFDHRAVWRAELSRMEMHLVSRRVQRLRVRACDLIVDLAAGETIWTESSYKFEPDQIVAMGERAGFRLDVQWIDPSARYALTLFQAK